MGGPRPRFPRRFFERPATEVAPDLLGARLHRRLPSGEVLVARIVETEAYEPGDPASHSFRGPTPRNAVMFGPPGSLYVYFVYGMHWCANVVTRPEGEGSAVLLRAAEPVSGLDQMRELGGGRSLRDLCSGPARLAQALAVAGDLNGEDLVAGTSIWLEGSTPLVEGDIVRSERVGVRAGAESLWRFREADSPFTSRGRVTPGPNRTGAPPTR